MRITSKLLPIEYNGYMGNEIHTSKLRWSAKNAKSDDFFKALDENSNVDIPIEDSGLPMTNEQARGVSH